MEALDPKDTSRAESFALWSRAPMPMVTLIKTLDVTRPVHLSRRRGVKLNLLLCWCAGAAASRLEEFLLLPAGDRMLRYDRLAVSTVVALPGGGISTCDIPFDPDLRAFEKDYLRLTRAVQDSGRPYDLSEDYMVLGTSALARHDIDGAVNLYAGIYNNPFLIWGRYRKRLFRRTLPVSFQFHHAQLDGEEAARFLDELQTVIRELKV